MNWGKCVTHMALSGLNWMCAWLVMDMIINFVFILKINKNCDGDLSCFFKDHWHSKPTGRTDWCTLPARLPLVIIIVIAIIVVCININLIIQLSRQRQISIVF